ncbi:unnamed protein product [Arabis nemorensis]|uniref:TF-B3 domain-containing protein n=1 Tax=Arabis nemorensis TaxID=586526 RepID=A0A565CB21_9BRAS|nr:unnamed protein product [Arabis nemorensis]
MAHTTLFSPANPHFFQPLLPGFQSHLEIPVKFFSKNIEGKHESKTLNLRSDASERTWKVKMEGHSLTNGWKEFVEAHDLRIGDFVVFRHEGDMLFHVTALGPSCCEIQYTTSRSHDEDEEGDETGESSRKKKKIVENVKSESDQSLSDLSSFSQTVTASNLSRDTMSVPMEFAKRNGLNKESQEIVLMNEEGKSWESELKSIVSNRVYIGRGWTSFCSANRLEAGDSCTFKLLRNTEKPVFRLCSRTKAERNKNIRSPEENRFVKLTPTPNSLELGKQHLPVSFTRANGLTKAGKIILVDKNGDEWSMKLKCERSHRSRSMYIMSGNDWKSYCVTNGVSPYESLTLELIRGGTSPLLKFCSKMEQSPFEVKTQKKARVQRCSPDQAQETRSNHDGRQNIAVEGETSRSSNKSTCDRGILKHTQPCSVSDHVAKVKQSYVDTLTSIRRFCAEVEKMEQKLEDSLQEVDNLVSCYGTQRGKCSENQTTSSSNNQV